MTTDQEPKNDLSPEDSSEVKTDQLIHGLPLVHWVVGLSCVIFTGLMYFWFESDRLSDDASFLFLTIPRFIIPPIGLIFFAIAIVILMGKNSPLEAYRSSALFLLELTAIFYFFIYSGIDHYLFESPLGEWLTKLTSEIEYFILHLLNDDISYTWGTLHEPRGRFDLGPDSQLRIIFINGACTSTFNFSGLNWPF